MGKKIIVATLGLNCEEVNIKLNKLEKQLDRIVDKQKLISLMKRENSLHEKWCNTIMPLKTFNPAQPKHNNITINMNRSDRKSVV